MTNALYLNMVFPFASTFFNSFTAETALCLIFSFALSEIWDFTTYLVLPFDFLPFLTALILNPKNSEYCRFRLTILDFSGLISRPNLLCSQPFTAMNIFWASLRYRQNILKSSAYLTM